TGNASDNFNYATLPFNAKAGETYTISFEIEVTHGDFDTVSMYEGYTGGINRVISINDNGRTSHTFTIRESATDADRILIYAGISSSTRDNGFILREVQIEKGTIATDSTPAPEDIKENDNHLLIDKINLLLSEPLRSVGDVKDRLFRDSDGLWKIERNVGE